MRAQHSSSRALTAHPVRAGSLWFGVLCGPLAAFANEQLEYLQVAWSCGRMDALTRAMLHIVPLALIMLCAVAAVVAWRYRTEPPDLSDEHAADADRSRRGFMALLGVGLSLFGIVVILAQWMPDFYLSPCLIV